MAAIGRRRFLVLAGAVAAIPSLRRSVHARSDDSLCYMTCAGDRSGRFFAVGLDSDGAGRFAIALPARGHGLALSPAHVECVVFGRRPGSFAAVVDLAERAASRWIQPAPGRSFYGHGTFSADGMLLYATEHDDATGQGAIGVYDASRLYERIGELAAGGIGPHDVRLTPDGRTLVVAVGGILSDKARDKLNIATMDPSVAYLDAQSGRLIEQLRPPPEWHKLSIRHLDITASGMVALAMQYEGDAGEPVPLVALHSRGGPLEFLRAADDAERALKHYTGSVAFDSTGTVVAATSPRGNVVALWGVTSRAYLGAVSATDVCGIASYEDGFVATGGDGVSRAVSFPAEYPEIEALAVSHDMQWDNHLVRVRD